MTNKEWKYDLAQIDRIAGELWTTIGNHKIIALYGEMGAGKTTLVHALCNYRKVSDHVTSPTFSIINEYRIRENSKFEKIYHLDLYRLKDEEEAIRAGIEDCIYSGNICFVEWPEKAPGLLPPDTISIRIQFVDANTRQLKLEFTS
ncbi:MAG: tRNA (adenosine(37)-N6)-threonylcarbamoyltransferase complex ATPase subunit type 1 TsaE [Bacteroidetes bacterium]|nr:MAG: tRNA (adenosine(37)-N6)-threonylcarbamoyltransferase complex ATPase subunit type 1 TsaE [Bacteroidota bacterium]